MQWSTIWDALRAMKTARLQIHLTQLGPPEIMAASC